MDRMDTVQDGMSWRRSVCQAKRSVSLASSLVRTRLTCLAEDRQDDVDNTEDVQAGGFVQTVARLELLSSVNRSSSLLSTNVALSQSLALATSYLLISLTPTSNSGQSSLPSPENLRSSPKRHSTRRQSLSPDYHQPRQQTPTKSTGTPTKQRTPRKDTPKKKRLPRLQCRIVACTDYFSNKDARDKHETHTCRMRKASSPAVTMDTEFPVPSHSELNLDPLLCRYPDCLKEYKNEKSRKKHELD